MEHGSRFLIGGGNEQLFCYIMHAYFCALEAFQAFQEVLKQKPACSDEEYSRQILITIATFSGSASHSKSTVNQMFLLSSCLPEVPAEVPPLRHSLHSVTLLKGNHSSECRKHCILRCIATQTPVPREISFSESDICCRQTVRLNSIIQITSSAFVSRPHYVPLSSKWYYCRHLSFHEQRKR